MSLTITEDGFQVYNLYMGNIPINFTEKILQTHFSSYGEVSSVEIRFSDNKTTRYALINFQNPDSATRALTTNEHNIWDGSDYVCKVVEIADSWWQPNFVDKLEIESDSLIMMLNDDCLIHLFSFLSTRERIKLSYMNERFKEIFKITNIRNKPVSLSNLTLMEIRFICREFGQLIQEINLECLSDSVRSIFKNRLETLNRAPKYVAKFCFELRSLYFTNLRIGENTKFSLLKNLTKISLRHCYITDDICFHLSKLQNLNHLDVSENYDLTGKYLKDFPELTHLNLCDCTGLKPGPILAFCSSKRIIENLKSLNLKSFNLRPQFFVKLAFLKKLESLVVTPSMWFGLLPDIKKLKHLIIYVGTRKRRNQQLTGKCFTNLETLFILPIPHNIMSLIDMDINFIFLMKNLKTLGLQYYFDLNDGHMAKIAAMPELTHLDITGCVMLTFNAFLELFKKPNKLQHVDISKTEISDIFSSFFNDPFGSEDVLKTVVETGRTTPHCTLYIGELNQMTIVSNDSVCPQILELLPWLTIVSKKSVFPGIKLRKKYCYEFED